MDRRINHEPSRIRKLPLAVNTLLAGLVAVACGAQPVQFGNDIQGTDIGVVCGREPRRIPIADIGRSNQAKAQIEMQPYGVGSLQDGRPKYYQLVYGFHLKEGGEACVAGSAFFDGAEPTKLRAFSGPDSMRPLLAATLRVDQSVLKSDGTDPMILTQVYKFGQTTSEPGELILQVVNHQPNWRFGLEHRTDFVMGPITEERLQNFGSSNLPRLDQIMDPSNPLIQD